LAFVAAANAQRQAVAEAPVRARGGAEYGRLCGSEAGQLRRRRPAVHLGVGYRQSAAKGDVVQAMFRGQLDPHGLDHACVPPLAQNAAGRDEARAGQGRDDPGTRAQGDVDDHGLDPVHKHRGTEAGARIVPRQTGLDPLKRFRLERGIGLGQVVADPKGAVQFVQGRRAKA